MAYERQVETIFTLLSSPSPSPSLPLRHPCASRTDFDTVYAAFLQAEGGPEPRGQPPSSEEVRAFRAEWNVWAYYVGESEPFPGVDPTVLAGTGNGREVERNENEEAGYEQGHRQDGHRDFNDTGVGGFENGVNAREEFLHPKPEHENHDEHRDHWRHDHEHEQKKRCEGSRSDRYDNEDIEQRESFVQRCVRQRVEKRGQKFERRQVPLVRGGGGRRRDRDERSSSPKKGGGYGFGERGRAVDTYFGGGVRGRGEGDGYEYAGGVREGRGRGPERDERGNVVDQGSAVRGIREDRGYSFDEGRGFSGDANVNAERRHLIRAADGGNRDGPGRNQSPTRSQKRQWRTRGGTVRGHEGSRSQRAPPAPVPSLRREDARWYLDEKSNGNGYDRNEEWIHRPGYENDLGGGGCKRGGHDRGRDSGFESGWGETGRENWGRERDGARDVYRPGGDRMGMGMGMGMGMDEGKWFVGDEVGEGREERDVEGWGKRAGRG